MRSVHADFNFATKIHADIMSLTAVVCKHAVLLETIDQFLVAQFG